MHVSAIISGRSAQIFLQPFVLIYIDYCAAVAGGKKQHAGHHAPSSGPHAGDKKSKSVKGSGGTKKGEEDCIYVLEN